MYRQDFVDSTPFDPAQGAFDTEYVLKVLLARPHENLVGAGPNSGPYFTPYGSPHWARAMAPRVPGLGSGWSPPRQ